MCEFCDEKNRKNIDDYIENKVSFYCPKCGKLVTKVITIAPGASIIKLPKIDCEQFQKYQKRKENQKYGK